MNYALENSSLKIVVDTLGGELQSITGKRRETEFLWNGNPEYWQNRAPLLFPIVGRLYNGSYTYCGQNYTLENHGFAKTKQFSLARQSDDSLIFTLRDSPETLEAYPFHFEIQIIYELHENALETIYRVRNTGEAVMYFSIGAHPGYRCPIKPNERIEDCYVLFDQKETCGVIPVAGEGLLEKNTQPFLKNQDSIEVSYVDSGALVFESLRSSSVTLASRKNNWHVDFTFIGFPYFALWKKPGAPYICLEPWYGLADTADFNGDFTQKKGIVRLHPNANFICSHTAGFFE